MAISSSTHLFLLGADYHLGDLLWLTAVLDEYRRQRQPARLVVGCPDRAISRILERNPLIDDLRYGEGDQLRAAMTARYGPDLLINDLRPLPVALRMLRDWRHHWPWLYYRDLWLRERGQWLATFLHLGHLRHFRPVLGLSDEDREAASALPAPYVALAPHIGQYRLPLAGRLWRAIKGWEADRWRRLASRLRAAGYEPITLAASGQAPIPGTRPVVGLPIRQVAGVIERAAALISGESGLWFIAAARRTPFVIVPWWLPRTVDWAAPMRTPYRLIFRQDAAVSTVFASFREVVDHDRP
ncbi:MAG: glycosyltransferase family 9 protein [Thermomicrobiales bacterium]